ncbi:hypothetical protein U1Q18_015719 [Sarracenia purpurea var. burkii]
MEGLVQFEAFLRKDGSYKILGQTEQKKTHSSSKSKKRGNERRINSKVFISDGCRANPLASGRVGYSVNLLAFEQVGCQANLLTSRQVRSSTRISTVEVAAEDVGEIVSKNSRSLCCCGGEEEEKFPDVVKAVQAAAIRAKIGGEVQVFGGDGAAVEGYVQLVSAIVLSEGSIGSNKRQI